MRLIAIALLMSVSLAAGSASARVGGFVAGRAYVQASDNDRMLYIAGLWDMMLLVEAESGPDVSGGITARAKRCFSGMGAPQIWDFVDAFMKSDPATQDYAMSSNFVAAIRTRCPA